MPHGIKWAAQMTAEQSRFFHACPKAVLFEIARYLALQIVGEENGFDAAFSRLNEEWHALYCNGIVPQKPVLERPKQDI